MKKYQKFDRKTSSFFLFFFFLGGGGGGGWVVRGVCEIFNIFE